VEPPLPLDFPPCPLAVHPSIALYDALTRRAVRT
jgi:hypothetical protein